MQSNSTCYDYDYGGKIVFKVFKRFLYLISAPSKTSWEALGIGFLDTGTFLGAFLLENSHAGVDCRPACNANATRFCTWFSLFAYWRGCLFLPASTFAEPKKILEVWWFNLAYPKYLSQYPSITQDFPGDTPLGQQYPPLQFLDFDLGLQSLTQQLQSRSAVVLYKQKVMRQCQTKSTTSYLSSHL